MPLIKYYVSKYFVLIVDKIYSHKYVKNDITIKYCVFFSERKKLNEKRHVTRTMLY